MHATATPSIAPVSTAAADRRLALSRRPDLIITPQQLGQEQVWLVKDPVSLRYYHLCAEEFGLLEMLDGTVSMAELKRKFEKAYAPLQLPFPQLQAFLGRLHESGLLLADAAGQAQPLLDRGARQRKFNWLAKAAAYCRVGLG